MAVATAIVLMPTIPGLALFYACMVRRNAGLPRGCGSENLAPFDLSIVGGLGVKRCRQSAH
jgi:hypothetical protein